MSQAGSTSRVTINVNKVRLRASPLLCCIFHSVNVASGGHRSLVWSCHNCIRHPKLYPYPYSQASSCRGLHLAPCGRVPVCHHRFGICRADSPVRVDSVDPSWLRRRFSIQAARRDSQNFERGERNNKPLVARHFLRQIGFFVLLSQANLSLTDPEHMVVVCYHTHYHCWFGQRSRFLADLPVFHC